MVEETGRTPADVTVMGVGDQGVWALDDLLDDGISWVDYVSLHIEERPLRSKRVPTRLFRRGEWRSAMEIWASPLSGDEKEERIKSCPNVAKLERYTTENRLWNEFAFVFADLGDGEMAEVLGGVTGCGGAFSEVWEAFLVAALPQPAEREQEGIMPLVFDLYRGERAYPAIVMEMAPGAASDRRAAKRAMARRQSLFVRDVLRGIEDAALDWREFQAFFRQTGVWKAWSAEGDTFESALRESIAALSPGGVLSAASKVFLLATGSEAALTLPKVTAGMTLLSETLGGEAEILMAERSEDGFGDGVRVHLAAHWHDSPWSK